MTVNPNLLQPPNEGNMHRDPLAQWHQANTGDPTPAETPASVAEARTYQRRQRSQFLDMLLRHDVRSFDRCFRDYYREDDAIMLALSDLAQKRALQLLEFGQAQ
jgi:hypothetical protein